MILLKVYTWGKTGEMSILNKMIYFTVKVTQVPNQVTQICGTDFFLLLHVDMLVEIA
jgi:hypothetical protein